MLSIRRHNCMEQSPSCKANISSVIEEIPRILWSQGFHYFVHQGHRLVPIMNQINRIHNPQSYSFKLHFNIILPHVASNFSHWVYVPTLCIHLFLSLCLPHAPFPHLILLDLISILQYFTPKRRWLLKVYTNKSFTSQNTQYLGMNNEPGNDFLH